MNSRPVDGEIEENVFNKTIENPFFQMDLLNILQERLKEAEEEKTLASREIQLRQQINLANSAPVNLYPQH